MTTNGAILSRSNKCCAGFWADVANELEDSCGFNVKYMYYFDDAEMRSAKCNFSDKNKHDIFFHKDQLAWNGLGFPKNKRINALDEQSIQDVAFMKLQALQMMDRLDPFGDAFSTVSRSYYFDDLFCRYLDIIDEMEIKILICPDTPHRVYDYIFYAAACYRGIKRIIFKHTSFERRYLIKVEGESNTDGFISVHSFRDKVDFNLLLKSKIDLVRGDNKFYKLPYMEALKLPHKAEETKRKNRLKKEGLVSIFKFFFKGMIFLFQSKNLKKRWSIYVRQGGTPEESGEYFWEKRVRVVRERKLARSFEKLYGEMILPLDLKHTRYVGVALHYQPERTTSPEGGAFADQILLLEILDRVLPSDVYIVVKEHSTQFLVGWNGATSPITAGRSKVFYKRLSKLSGRVKFVSTEVPPFEFIDGAIGIATVTGTIGFEALLRSKPVICFGDAWYKGAPGVYPVKTVGDLDAFCRDVFDKMYKFPTKSVEDYFSEIQKNIVFFDCSGGGSPNYAESVDSVVTALSKAIKI